jgi:6-phosphogluconolactonase (cycloisomerase 2 family)
MTPDKWEQTRGHILDSFSNIEESSQELFEPEVGKKDVIIFDGPVGRMKLEYFTRPVVLDRKTHGSRRIGSHTEVEYTYSNTEFSHQLKAAKWDEDADDWVEIEMAKGSFEL